jgi:predicted HD superfamily hydrolase involved in NAD metabolism
MNYIAKLKPIPPEVEPLSEQRILHLLGTAEKAGELARRWGEDEQRAVLAGLYHDLSRDWGDEKARRYSMEQNLAVDEMELASGTGLLHGAISAHLANKLYNNCDSEILTAIRYHTTCWQSVDRLGAILIIADMVEENRGKYFLKKQQELLKKKNLFDILIELLIWKEEHLHRIKINPHNRQLEALKELQERRNLDC